MEFMEVIKNRKSIRKYKQDPVADDLIVKILETARLAFSGSNRQPWHFIIVKDEDSRRTLAEAADGQTFVGYALVIVAVFGDPSDSPENYRRDPMIAFKKIR